LASARLLIALLAATLGLAAAPSFAFAAPPENDNYLESNRINQPNTLLQDNFQELDWDTTEATEQVDPDLFGDPGGTFEEVTRCDFQSGRQAHYGKTVWWDIFPDVDGEVTITASGMDAVIGFVPYDFDTSEPFYDEWFCADDPANDTTETESFTVEGGRSYSIQIGGWGGDSPGGDPANADSGLLDFTFHFEPDSDGDGVLDEDDNCGGTPGLQQFAGCPDGDGDGVPEPPDACPGVKGDLSNGCKSTPPPPPRPDNDHDGVFDDGPDQCVGENASGRDANGNGCLDLRTFSPDWIFKPGSYFVRHGGRVILLGLKVQRFGVAGVPNGARVVVTCSRHACRRMSKRARRGRVLFGRLRGDKLRAGVKLTIRVSAPGYVGRARIYTIQKNDWDAKPRCLMPGSAKLRSRCSTER
jgi:hypothetical protein